MAKKQEQVADGIEAVESALSRSEQFIEDNQHILTTVVVIVIAVVGLYLGYNKFYLLPLEDEAQSQMFVAEQHFERDSFNLALNGDLNYPGFLGIIDDYSPTKAANLANYYAGISYLHLGQFESAIEYLEAFSSNDKMLKPISLGAIGDASMELGNKEEAASFYIKAAKASENEFTTPIYLMKAGQAYELVGDNKNALKVYKQIKEKYKKSAEGRVIEKYITRAEINIK
ncbi:MAG: tetratricopeptide repeat protein [Bacteroidetes bacterium 4572_117]|nr:MAG: tetratricopeptide repeat protein [Bacteroidetes bacterium 4572_117]